VEGEWREMTERNADELREAAGLKASPKA